MCCCLGLGVDNNLCKSNIVVDAADKQRIYIVAGLFKWGYSGWICLLSNHCNCLDDTCIWWKRGWWLIWTSDIWAASNIWALPAALCLRPLLCDYQRDISLQLQHRHDHHHHKGRVALTKRNYFWKISEGGWVIFNQNINVADFGLLNRAF